MSLGKNVENYREKTREICWTKVVKEALHLDSQSPQSTNQKAQSTVRTQHPHGVASPIRDAHPSTLPRVSCFQSSVLLRRVFTGHGSDGIKSNNQRLSRDAFYRMAQFLQNHWLDPSRQPILVSLEGRFLWPTQISKRTDWWLHLPSSYPTSILTYARHCLSFPVKMGRKQWKLKGLK